MRISEWSSDVCSSDLLKEGKVDVAGYLPQFLPPIQSDPNLVKVFDTCTAEGPPASVVLVAKQEFIDANREAMVDMQIGRASCRERVGPYGSISVVAVSLKKNKSYTI